MLASLRYLLILRALRPLCRAWRSTTAWTARRPALVVVGEVVALHATLAWFGGAAAAAAPVAGLDED